MFLIVKNIFTVFGKSAYRWVITGRIPFREAPMATPIIAFSEAGISGQNEALVDVDPLLSIIKGDWRNFLGQRLLPMETDDIRKHAQTGRPLGDVRFVTRLECLLGRELRPRKPGRKPKKGDN